LESKSLAHGDSINTPKEAAAAAEANWSPDTESSQATGGYSVTFSLSVVQVLIGLIIKFLVD
jgi:exocyst complex component 4